MANSNSPVAVTFPLLPLLTVLFIALKLCKVIAWSWWWVLAPSWIPALLAIALVTFLLIGTIFRG